MGAQHDPVGSSGTSRAIGILDVFWIRLLDHAKSAESVPRHHRRQGRRTRAQDFARDVADPATMGTNCSHQEIENHRMPADLIVGQ